MNPVQPRCRPRWGPTDMDSFARIAHFGKVLDEAARPLFNAGVFSPLMSGGLVGPRSPVRASTHGRGFFVSIAAHRKDGCSRGD